MIIYNTGCSDCSDCYNDSPSLNSLDNLVDVDLSNSTAVTINSLRQALQIQSLLENGHKGVVECL